MTDPDERIINRALMYLEDDDEAIAEHRENARSALHRIFRRTRKLEKVIDGWMELYVETAHEVERLRKFEAEHGETRAHIMAYCGCGA